MSDLFQIGMFTLNSGKTSDFKIECDELSDGSIAALAAQIVKRLTFAFGSVEGVPRGGLRLAQELRKFVDPESQIHLICDDVLTTGGSMERAKDRWLTEDQRRSPELVFGIVIFARTLIYPKWIKPLFQMTDLS